MNFFFQNLNLNVWEVISFNKVNISHNSWISSKYIAGTIWMLDLNLILYKTYLKLRIIQSYVVIFNKI